MTVETRALVTSAVDPVVADAIQLYERMNLLRDTLAPDLTDGELSLFAMVANRSGLDPFAKQIYAIKRSGRVTFQTGIDGYRSTAARTGQYEGSSDPAFGEWVDEPFPHPVSATVTAYRWQNGHRVEQTATAWWDEYYPGPKKVVPSGPKDTGYMWLTKPRVMLGKVAEALALRKAFPYVLNDLYVREEMDQAGPGDQPALVAAAQAPTARERLAARRAAMESIAQPDADPEPPAEDEDDIADAAFRTESGTVIPEADAEIATGVSYDAPDSRSLTPDQFNALMAQHKQSPDYVRTVRKAMFPNATTVGDLTDDQRGALATEILSGD